MAVAQQSIVAQQDSLRTLRNFLSFANGAVSDQTYAEEDGYAVNPARQFYTQTQAGVSVEGQPIMVARPQTSGDSMNTMLFLGAAGLLAYFLLK